MPVMTFSPKQYNDDLMIEGFGALPVVPPKYVPANDNVEGGKRYHSGGLVGGVTGEVPAIVKRDYVLPRALHEALIARGQYIGLRRPLSSDDGQPTRNGDFMQTAHGRKFWPLDPRADEVFIDDIAHSLSLQCRYAGHCLRFYSVAEHCVLMARKLRWEGVDVALWALLHDAAEAYTVDVPRPLKRHLVGYKEAEAKVMATIAERFGLSSEMPAVVHDADTRIVADELVNMVPMPWHAKHDNPLCVELKYWSPEKAQEEFMATFDALMDSRARGMA